MHYKYLIEQTLRIYDACIECTDFARLMKEPLAPQGYEPLLEIEHYLPIIYSVINQTKRGVFDDESTPSLEKIYSIFEEKTNLIKKGKAGKLFEFGHVTTITQTGESFIIQ